MDVLFLLVVLGSSVWVLIDAKRIGVRKGLVDGIANIGPWGWFFGCILLWIVVFPLYLIKRDTLKKAAASGTTKGVSGTGDKLAQLEKLAELKAKGVLTDAEFAMKKKELLS